jgi:hypothetical protein
VPARFTIQCKACLRLLCIPTPVACACDELAGAAGMAERRRAQRPPPQHPHAQPQACTCSPRVYVAGGACVSRASSSLTPSSPLVLRLLFESSCDLAFFVFHLRESLASCPCDSSDVTWRLPHICHVVFLCFICASLLASCHVLWSLLAFARVLPLASAVVSHVTCHGWHSRWQAGAAKSVCRMGCGVSHHAHDVVSATCKDKKTGIIKQLLTPQQLQKLKDKQVCVAATPWRPPPPPPPQPPPPWMLSHMHLFRLLAYSRPLARTRWLSCLLLHHKLKSVAKAACTVVYSTSTISPCIINVF